MEHHGRLFDDKEYIQEAEKDAHDSYLLLYADEHFVLPFGGIVIPGAESE